MLASLNMRLRSNSSVAKKSNSPSFVLKIYEKCIEYRIAPEIMFSLNYNDLLYLIVEKDIKSLEEYIQNQEKDRLNKKGIEIQDATNEQATAFFRGGGKH